MKTLVMATQDNRKLNDLYFADFNRDILEDLQQRFLMRPMLRKGKDGNVDPNASMAAGGAQEVILYILKRIEDGELARKSPA